MFRNSWNALSVFLWQAGGFASPVWICHGGVLSCSTQYLQSRGELGHVGLLCLTGSTFGGLSLSKQWICPCRLAVHTLLKGNKDADSELKSNLLGWINSDVTSCTSVKLHLVQDLYMPSTSLNLSLSPIQQPRHFCEENCQGQNTSILPGTLERLISPLVFAVSTPSAVPACM